MPSSFLCLQYDTPSYNTGMHSLHYCSVRLNFAHRSFGAGSLAVAIYRRRHRTTLLHSIAGRSVGWLAKVESSRFLRSHHYNILFSIFHFFRKFYLERT